MSIQQKKYQCGNCCYESDGAYDIRNHVERKHAVAPQPMDIDQKFIYTCTLCQTNFQTRSVLDRHNKNMHNVYSQTT